MNFFFVDFRPSLDDIYPLVVDISDGYLFESPNSIDNIVNNEPLGFTPDINYLIADSKLKYLPDNLSQHYIYTMGLLVSAKLKDLLCKNRNVQKHTFYNARIYYKNAFYDYFWMHIEEKIENYIDFKKSIFLLRKEDEVGVYKEVVFKNFDDFKKRSKKWGDTMEYVLSIKKIYFLENFAYPELFFLNLLKHKLYISEKLCTEFKKNKICGFEFSNKPTIFE